MEALAVELVVRDRAALCIGGGDEIAARCALLARAGLRVTLVSPDPGAAAEALASAGTLRLERRAFADADLEDAFVVYVAPGDDALAARLHAWAVREGRLVCAIDRPEASTFTGVAVAEAAGLRLTVSSGGASPGLSRRVREDLEAGFAADPRLARFVDALRAARARLPRGERARRMAEAVRGFGVSLALRFPPWFERDEPPP